MKHLSADQIEKKKTISKISNEEHGNAGNM